MMNRVIASFLAWLLAGCILPAALPGAARAQNGNVTLHVVNGTPFTSGPVDVDGAHCGWNYVLGGGAFYATRVPAPSDFPVGCRIAITNADPLPTGSNATGAPGLSEPLTGSQFRTN